MEPFWDDDAGQGTRDFRSLQESQARATLRRLIAGAGRGDWSRACDSIWCAWVEKSYDVAIRYLEEDSVGSDGVLSGRSIFLKWEETAGERAGRDRKATPYMHCS
jgi:hypothetical protein